MNTLTFNCVALFFQPIHYYSIQRCSSVHILTKNNYSGYICGEFISGMCLLHIITKHSAMLIYVFCFSLDECQIQSKGMELLTRALLDRPKVELLV